MFSQVRESHQANRNQGWSIAEGDEHYAKQRTVADNANKDTAKAKKNAYFFYTGMQRIGKQLHSSTQAFRLPSSPSTPPRILDMCMAPGGFLHAALQRNKPCTATAFTLPVSSGGHARLLKEGSNVAIKELDITLLAADMGMSNPDEIPTSHPDATKFLTEPHLQPTDLYDLILLDGQVLRTHSRAAYREKREHHRLKITQLALGLQHAQQGGTIVMLLHKPDALDNIELLHLFNQFSTIELFKPTIMHRERSSFYLVAKNIRTDHPQVATAIREWKREWFVATFGTDEEFFALRRREEADVHVLLEEFGQTLIALATGVWSKQAEALKTAPWMRSAKQGETLGEDGGKEERCV